MNYPTRERVKFAKAAYPPYTRIELIYMDDPQSPPAGTQGTVTHVDDFGDLHMKWDNGSTIALLPDKDEFKVISRP